MKKLYTLFFSLFACTLFSVDPAQAQSGIITTFAGNGTSGFSGDGGLAIDATLNGPAATAIDAAGNMYIADYGNNRIRKVLYPSGLITTIAGTGVAGYSGDGAPAAAAEINNPNGIAIDASGNIYFADGGNSCIRKINALTGLITTVAGTGTAGYSGDHGPATLAKLNYPAGLAFDAAGDLCISDFDNHRIRKVVMSTGVITTIAGSGAIGYTGDGGPASTAKLHQPSSIAFDASGNLYIAEWGNSTVRKVSVSSGNIITTIAGTGTGGYSGDGGPGTAAQIDEPLGVAVDPDGNVYIGDWYHNSRLRMVSASDGTISTVAGDGTSGYNGDGGAATSGQITGIDGVTTDASGNLYISDEFNGAIRKITCTICFLAVGTVPNNAHTEIYPNPAHDALSISSTEKIFHVVISNLLGQVVYKQDYNSNKIEADIADIPKGVYIVRINDADVRKFVKE